jgi:hypothetical protein
VTLNEPLAVRPPLSVTLQFTVVVPRAKVEPDAGLQVGVGGGASSASVAVAVNEAEAPAGPTASRVRSVGRLRCGGVFGTTSMTKSIEVDPVRPGVGRPVAPVRVHDIEN